ncbi:MAG: hypothetical protein WCJ44_26780 [Runella sp.]
MMKNLANIRFSAPSFVLRWFNPVVFKRISDPEELTRFEVEYSEKSKGLQAKPDYLSKACTLVFYRYTHPDRWLGGVALNSQAPFRYLASFDEAKTQELLNSKTIDPRSLLEITCLWMNSHRISSFERFMVYFLFLTKVCLSPQQTILCGSFHQGLIKMYEQLFDSVLVEGVSEVAGHRAYVKNFYTSRDKLMWRMTQLVFSGSSVAFRPRRKAPKPALTASSSGLQINQG